MTKITNVRWGLSGEPGQPCLYFDLNGRPASAFWEQKRGMVDQGLLSIDFEDGKPSDLPAETVLDQAGNVMGKSDTMLRSPWLIERMREMVDTDKFEDGRNLGDAPEGE